MAKTDKTADGKPSGSRTLMGVGGAPAGAPRGPDEEADPLVGTKYRTLRELGRGGMGTVYLAEHRDLGRRFAVKVLLPELSANAVLVERLRREARAASTIRHPGIVDVTDFGETAGGQAFIVMEHLEGEDLATVLARQGTIDQERAAEVAIAVCGALGAAHSKGIVHRDVKPENILLARGPEGEEVVKVVDFGLALSAEGGESRLTQHGATFGTPEYMAPEQITGRAVTAATDVYALGSVLYEMLSGSPPFAEATSVETMARKLHDDPEPLRERAATAEIHPALEAVVATALAVASWQRYGSMGEMADALAGALREIRSGAPVGPGEPDEADDGEAVAPAPARPRRGARVALLAGLGALAAGGVVALVLAAGTSTERGRGGATVASVPAASGPDGGLGDGAARPPDAGPPPRGAGDGGDGDGGAPDREGDGGASPALAPASPRVDREGDGAAAPPTARETDRDLARRRAEEGHAHLRARRLAEAERAFEEALRLDPSSATARAGLGRVAFERGQHEAAVSHLERALRSRPADLGSRLLLGSAYLRLGQTARAVAEWERVLARDPDNAAAARSLAAVRGGER